MTRQESTGKWSAATYALKKIANTAVDPIGHREHRDHGGPPTPSAHPMPPMLPMPYAGVGPTQNRDADDLRPALGPPGDSLADFDGGSSAFLGRNGGTA
jgi:hypothetical protein